jgi:hypothetical protein
MAKREPAYGVEHVLDADEVRSVLRETFFQGTSDTGQVSQVRAKGTESPKPEHYRVVCISMYTEDLERLDARVAALKRAGHRKMSRSAFIRFALDHVDESLLPRGYG